PVAGSCAVAGASPALPARCRLFAGITKRPRATSSRMNSAVTRSRSATRRISGDTWPRRAASIWVSESIVITPATDIVSAAFREESTEHPTDARRRPARREQQGGERTSAEAADVGPPGDSAGFRGAERDHPVRELHREPKKKK